MADAALTAPAAWPLTGRESELAQLRAARSAGATGVVISGPDGVGRSRLVRAAVDEAAAGGSHVAWARATRSSADIPLAALAALVPAGTLLAGDAGFIQTVVGALREQARGGDIVLGVDDAQLLDAASATVLLHLAEHLVAFVVAAVRTGEPSPDALTALWKDAGAARIDLRPLDDATLWRLVEAVLGGPLQRDAQRWVAQNSKGNLLYAQQLLAGAVEGGALALIDGSWQLTRRPVPNASLRELIAARMGALSDAERSSLELLALGEPLTPAEAEQLFGGDMLAALESKRMAVAEAAADGVVEARVAHPLYVESICAEMPAARGRAHRVRLAELVSARSPRTPADSVRIARWLIDAGEPVSAARLLEAAKASNLAPNDAGAELARRAVAAGAGAEANMLLASSHHVHGRSAEAEAALAEVEGAIQDRELAFEYLRERSAVLLWGLGRGGEAEQLLERALAWFPDAGWQSDVGMLRLQFAALSRPPGALADELEQALADATPGDQAARWLTRTVGADRFWSGRTREAQAMLGDVPAIPLRDELGFLEFVSISTFGLASGCDLTDLEQRMRRAFDSSAEAADPAAAGLAAVTVAATSYLAGRVLDCRLWVNEALAQSARQDPFAARLIARSLQAGASLALGDHEGAAAAAKHLEEEVTAAGGARGGGTLRRGVAPWIARGRAWGMLARADPPSAQALLLHEADELEWAPVSCAELRYEAMRAGRPARELAAVLARLTARCDAPLTAAYAAHAAARAGGDGSAMLDAADSFAGLGASLYGSEAAAHAAAAFASEGRHDSARRAAARSRELQPAEQGVAPMSIEGVDSAATELTPREAQMVELAARGLTNAEIADTLVLSTRTVETHIYRAMRKLGVSDRRAFRVRAEPAS